MQRLTENKVILVVRNTRLDDLVIRFNSVSQAQFYVEHLGADFGDYRAEHTRYHQAVRQTENHLQRLGRVQVVHRSFLPTFVFGEHDTVVVVGQDGLVANTVKYLDGQPVIGTGFKMVYDGHSQLQSGPLPAGNPGEFDVITCQDLDSGELQQFKLAYD